MEPPKPPAYIRGLEGPVSSLESMGSEDFTWTGTDGELDVDDFTSRNGAIPISTLQCLIAGLIEGYRPKLNGDTSRKKTLGLLAFLESRSNRGNNRKPDEAMLIELGRRIYVQRLHLNWSLTKLEVKPLAREVIEEFSKFGLAEHPHNLDSAARRLVTAFKKNRDQYLVFGTLDPHEVAEHIDKIDRVFSALRSIGIRVSSAPLRNFHPGRLTSKRRERNTPQVEKAEN